MVSFGWWRRFDEGRRTDPARLEDARSFSNTLLGYAKHLGLYAEQTGSSGERAAISARFTISPRSSAPAFTWIERWETRA